MLSPAGARSCATCGATRPAPCWWCSPSPSASSPSAWSPASAGILDARPGNADLDAINPASARSAPRTSTTTLLQTVRRMPGVADAAGPRQASACASRCGRGRVEEPAALRPSADFDDLRINIVRAAERRSGRRAARRSLLERSVAAPSSALQRRRHACASSCPTASSARCASPARSTTSASAPELRSAASATATSPATRRNGWAGRRATTSLDHWSPRTAGRGARARRRRGGASQDRERAGASSSGIVVTSPASTRPTTSSRPSSCCWACSACFALLLSGFLVINTISALLTQQVRQIGVMKAIGARSRDIVRHVPGAWCWSSACWRWWWRCRWARSGPVALAASSPSCSTSTSPASASRPRVLALAGRGRAARPAAGRALPGASAARASPCARRSAATAWARAASAGAGSTELLERVALPLAADAALAAQHLPAQGPPGAHPGHADAGRRDLHRRDLSVRESCSTTLDDAFAYYNYDVDVDSRPALPHRRDRRGWRDVPGVVDVGVLEQLQRPRRLSPDGSESAKTYAVMLALPADSRADQADDQRRAAGCCPTTRTPSS